MAHFFINRPVFAWVIAIVIMLAGVLSIFRLPIEQYPTIAPPAVTITAIYPGASAETVESSVTQIIEQNLTGIDYMRYFVSTSDASGVATITITFDSKANPDIAQVQVQNKLQSAIPLLPQPVQAQGIRVTKSNNTFLLVVGFYSEGGVIPQQELADLLNFTVKDAVARVNGVGDITVFGHPHAMRIWLDPNKLLSYGLTAMDVRQAIQAQNANVSSGQLGGLPAITGQEINASIRAQDRLQTVEQFEQVLVRVNTDGSRVFVKDIARVELGSDGYDVTVRYKRLPAAGLAVSLASGANALDTAVAVKKKIAELASFLPKEVKIIYPYDTTPFVRLSIQEVVKTLIEAAILVCVVLYLFLQNLRSTLIPAIAVPVVVLGTFAALAAFGFSINVLTMFAMVLAIGSLVDDAIVVVENFERIHKEERLSAKEATKKSMEQITGALIGIGLVLSAVFIPMAFFSGSVGVIYRQFSLTIVSAMILSVIVAIVLSPSLCVTFFSSEKEPKEPGLLFRNFNRGFDALRDRFAATANGLMKRKTVFLGLYALLIAVGVWLFVLLPTAFLPDEDQGVMYLLVNTPPGATLERTLHVSEQIEDYLLSEENALIDHLFTVTGYSFAGTAQNVAVGFVGLKDWSERTKKSESVFALVKRSMQFFRSITDAQVFAFYPPSIRDLGRFAGFSLELVDRGGLGHEALMKARDQMLRLAAKNPQLQGVHPVGLSDVPQYRLHMDHEKSGAVGISVNDINQTLQIAWGSAYIDDFIDQGRVKKVYLQADAPFRMMPEDVARWYVRNRESEMISFDSFADGKWSFGSPKLERFNGISAVNIEGGAAPGVSTGAAMAAMEEILQQLPKGFGIEWIGLSYEERLSGQQAPALYAFSALFVFLCLAALYESWSIPFSVMLSVPLGILGAVAASKLFHLNNDVYLQVGLLTTMGLVSKNAILIVEFAKELYEQGHPLRDAALAAAKRRFRPIVMTSMTFILGVLPLALAHGASSGSQNAIGISVVGGMVTALCVATPFVPLFYLVVQQLRMRKGKPGKEEADPNAK